MSRANNFMRSAKIKIPNDGERLTQRSQKEGQRRVFYDFTCSAPKSVSVLAVTLDDQRLIEAHEEAAGSRSVNSKPSPRACAQAGC
jgi:conjugative relaxase-like TrwC/TraI family protein